MYLLVPLGRGDRGDDSCGGGVDKGAYVAVVATVVVASPESVVRLLVRRGSSLWREKTQQKQSSRELADQGGR